MKHLHHVSKNWVFTAFFFWRERGREKARFVVCDAKWIKTIMRGIGVRARMILVKPSWKTKQIDHKIHFFISRSTCVPSSNRRLISLLLGMARLGVVVKTNHKPAFVSCLPARFDSRLEHAWLILTQLDSFSHRSRIRRENRIIWEISDKAGSYITVVQMYENIQQSLICIILKVTYID